MKRISFKQKIVLVIFGLFLCILLLEIGLRIGGFVILSLQEHENRMSIRQKGTYRIMCLGESTTAGGKNSYPSQLQEILNQKDIGVNFSVINKGIARTNTGGIVYQLENNLDKYNPQMVITMMGINDMRYTLLYEDILAKKTTLFFKSFRTYKLIKLLHLHIINKAREIGIYKAREEKEDLAKINDTTQSSNLKEQEETLKKSIEINPGNEEGYIGLGRHYRDTGEQSKAGEMFKEAIEINPGNEWNYVELGIYYRDTGEQSKAEEMFKKAIEINPGNEEGYIGLGRHYRDTGEQSKAGEMFKKAIEINPGNDRSYGALANYYRELGKYSLAEGCSRKAESLRMEYYDPVTTHNYQRLNEIVTQRGIKLGCVQYPIRSVASLKKIFNNTKGIIFVDNEKIFKEAVKKQGYNEYFTDIFACDFGHCTEIGNRLLAENIANAILKECF
ncbi:tetratricopeptide repeat protein [Candidatus Omnitrophota bacterium]